MDNLIDRVKQLRSQLHDEMSARGIYNMHDDLKSVEEAINAPDFWRDNNRAQASVKLQAKLAKQVEPYDSLEAALDELLEMSKIGDESMAGELEKQFESLRSKFDELKSAHHLDGPYDDHDVILNLYAGAGGTDAQDWAEMLLRMYVRWAESQGLKVKTLEQSSGDEAGLKSATLEITGGNYLYGKLAGEHGVHRLVRLSPFNADHKRQTSFAKVEILPLIDRPDDVEIDDKDLKIDVFRSGGAGGQSVNTTDSAVRVTHLPTGITVAIQNERSQLQNKETAMAVLRSRLAALQLEQHAASVQELKGPNTANEWGSQIRSYVLHPYKQVKDNRTGYESSDPQAILDGHLDGLINAWLENKPA